MNNFIGCCLLGLIGCTNTGMVRQQEAHVVVCVQQCFSNPPMEVRIAVEQDIGSRMSECELYCK